MDAYFLHVGFAAGRANGILMSVAFALSLGSLWFATKAIGIGVQRTWKQRRTGR
jgi:hypothetical protein